MELYWYIIVIIFIIIKIFFYVCWYRSRQRQLDAYLSNPRNAQIVIVGGRAYLHQLCEQRQTAPVWSNWYGVQDDTSAGEPSATLPPAPSYSQLEVPPPYESVSSAEDPKPPPYCEFAPAGPSPTAYVQNIPDNFEADSLGDAPPPYTPTILTNVERLDASQRTQAPPNTTNSANLQNPT